MSDIETLISQMKRILAGLCLVVVVVTGGKTGSETSWMRDMEEGVLPSLTEEQKMLLFGGKVSMSGPPIPNPWWKDVEEGNLPEGALTSDLKLQLFGATVTVRAADNQTETARSFDDFVDTRILEFQSPFSDEKFSFNVGNLLPSKTDVEGKILDLFKTNFQT